MIFFNSVILSLLVLRFVLQCRLFYTFLITFKQDGKTITTTPHAQFYVKSGYKYRFRLVSTLSGNCLYRFSVEDHDLKIIAFDGNFIKPKVVKTIVAGPGKCFH